MSKEKQEAFFAWEPHDYLDNQGRQVQERRVVCGQAPHDFCKFVSYGAFIARTPMGDLPPHPYEIRLPHATNVKEAFEMIDQYKDSAEKEAAEEFRAEISKRAAVESKKLWAPGNGPPELGQPQIRLLDRDPQR